MESRKMILMNLFAWKERRHKCGALTLDSVGEGESEMNREISISRYTLSGVSQVSGEKLLCSAGSPVWGSVMT